MELLIRFWPVMLVGIVVTVILVLGSVSWAVSRSSQNSKVDSRQRLIAKYEELQHALRNAFDKIIKSGKSDPEVIDLLIDASAHLKATALASGPYRIVGLGDWLCYYEAGLELVKQAEQKAGV